MVCVHVGVRSQQASVHQLRKPSVGVSLLLQCSNSVYAWDCEPSAEAASYASLSVHERHDLRPC